MLSFFRALLGWELRSPESSQPTSSGPSPDEHEAHRMWLAAREAPPFRRDVLYKELTQHMVRAFGPALVRYCAGQFHGDRTRGEDAAQKAFMTFWGQLGRFEGRSSLRSWLFGIAFNHCRSDRRDDVRDRALESLHEGDIRDQVHIDSGDPTLALERNARRRQVLAALERLDPREAWILRKRLFEQLDYQSMLSPFQAAFGTSIATAEGLRTAFFHAKTKLFEILEAP